MDHEGQLFESVPRRGWQCRELELGLRVLRVHRRGVSADGVSGTRSKRDLWGAAGAVHYEQGAGLARSQAAFPRRSVGHGLRAVGHDTSRAGREPRAHLCRAYYLEARGLPPARREVQDSLPGVVAASATLLFLAGLAARHPQGGEEAPTAAQDSGEAFGAGELCTIARAGRGGGRRLLAGGGGGGRGRLGDPARARVSEFGLRRLVPVLRSGALSQIVHVVGSRL
mmetsp:Transcript_66010/g.171305  ORF Transcript_66010/g.171305 Transcript_66010/m.171305 type:complete len:226 (-) Transcript_66010:1178-1855(-)